MDDRNSRAAAAIAEALDDGVDVAEFLANALCTVAAQEGGIEEVLRNRSGSWEAGHVRSLMEGTVGPDGEGLAMYRKDDEPEPGLCDAELRLKRGEWHLNVRVPGLLGNGPRAKVPTSTGDSTVPTITAREYALAGLGYTAAEPGQAWKWLEVQEDPDQPAAFIVYTQVRPLDPQASAGGE